VILNNILEIAPAPGNGDCNNDGAVNILDVTCVLNIILEITPPPPPPPPPPPTCPSGQKDCPGVGCIPESFTCCENLGACPSDFPLCTGTSICCPGGFPILCPDNIFCATDLLSCPLTCPSGQKDCPGVGCIPDSAECCGDGTSCTNPDFRHCTGISNLCCPTGFPQLCPNVDVCVSDLSNCPTTCPSGGSCPDPDFIHCTDIPNACCATGFPVLCPNLINCATDLSFCP